MIVGGMLLLTVQALGELAVLFPINGAFYQYICRYIDPSWYVIFLRSPYICQWDFTDHARGFAMGWNYAIGWLVLLP